MVSTLWMQMNPNTIDILVELMVSNSICVQCGAEITNN